MTQGSTFTIAGLDNNTNKTLAWACEFENPVMGQHLNTLENLGYWCVEPTRICVTYLKSAKNLAAKVGYVALLILSLPLTIIGVALRSIGKALPHETRIRTDEIFTRTNSHTVDEIYEVLQAFDQKARQVGLKYLASSGTALGIPRHGGMIPWDDDADINVLDTERANLEQVLQQLSESGFTVTPFFDRNLIQVRKQNPHDPAHAGTLDIFLMSRFDDPVRGSVYKCTSEFQRAKLPNEFYYQDEIDSIEDFSFGPTDKELKIPAIKKMTRYLHQNYGQNCLTTGVQTHDHVLLFGFIPFPLPRLSMEAVRIVDQNCAQGNRWTGQSKRSEIE